MKEILNECYKLTSKLKNELKLYKCEISKDLKSLSEQLKTLDINKSVLNVFILKSKEIKEIDNALLPIQTYEDCIFVCNKEDNYKLNKELIIKYYSEIYNIKQKIKQFKNLQKSEYNIIKEKLNSQGINYSEFKAYYNKVKLDINFKKRLLKEGYDKETYNYYVNFYDDLYNRNKDKLLEIMKKLN